MFWKEHRLTALESSLNKINLRSVGNQMSKTRIVVVGGGTAGLTVSAQLLSRDPELDVTIIEPSDKHYYQPLR